MNVVTSSTPDTTALRERLTGALVQPGEPGWDAVRAPWNLAIDQLPFAVATPETGDDVVAVIEFARRNGLRVAPQGTGHGAGALGDLAGTILLRTGRLDGVEVDPEHQTVRVGAGVIWQAVADAADEHDLAVLAGSAPDVGVAGYTLGGGMSWLARKYGLSAANLNAAEVVTADGRIMRIDREHEPELFWAIRGGGGNFAIVTALELAAFKLAEVYAGWLIWPIEDAQRILLAWRDWVAQLPDEVTSCLRLLHVPPFPEIPEPFRGGSFVAIEAVSCGDRVATDEHLKVVRALEPQQDTFRVMRPRELGEFHLDPEHPTPAIGNGMLLAALPDDVVEGLRAHRVRSFRDAAALSGDPPTGRCAS